MSKDEAAKAKEKTDEAAKPMTDEEAKGVVGGDVHLTGWERDQQRNYIYTSQQWREVRRNR